MVNIKLDFMDWLFYNLVILIKQWQIPYKYLDKVLFLSRNQVFCLKNWQLWRALTTIDLNNFCGNFAHVSYLPMSTKRIFGIFLILFRTWDICQNKNRPGFCILTETRLINNSRSKQNKKNPKRMFRIFLKIPKECSGSFYEPQ